MNRLILAHENMNNFQNLLNQYPELKVSIKNTKKYTQTYF